ncbi:SRPBCC family protein [Allomuricauda sp. F6463D]|uniref:SRPBCC family protein n=1 Tax=Allomuricauda sp. F6463D TaxID=2926409 RepID=UPI001FF48391|nr:SRPBCC domain-containing protein [Muricauda sp. F6463D]MCK0159623.1 SRPBCC domain-containing protein [Muricauda sp. F6463D]
MENALIIIKEQVVEANPKEIWKVITTPKYFKEWMFVPGKATDENSFGLGSKIEWRNDKDIVYLTGKVIHFVPNQKLVISMQDISWKTEVPKEAVTYEFHLVETSKGTKIKFYLGDLAVDPEGQLWYDAYNSSNEIGAIEQLVKHNREKK